MVWTPVNNYLNRFIGPVLWVELEQSLLAYQAIFQALGYELGESMGGDLPGSITTKSVPRSLVSRASWRCCLWLYSTLRPMPAMPCNASVNGGWIKVY